jgi:perosamine synthetase
MTVRRRFFSWPTLPIRGLLLYPRHRLDASAGDLLFGLSACLWAFGRRRLEAEVGRAFPPVEDALACFSVRSGFDLLLGALGLAPGEEVLVSAVTHPDMVRIIEAHGLGVVPVDLETATLEPRCGLLEEALSPKTRVILVAHLFGGRFDLGPVAAFARRKGLLLVEDCAQAFRGPGDPGDPLAAVSMFSFGTLKTASAVGGAVLHVHDPDLLERMRRSQERWPVQRRRHYALRLLKTLCLVLIGRPLPYGLLARAFDLLGRDLDDLVNGAVQAFPASGNASDDLLSRLAPQPASAWRSAWSKLPNILVRLRLFARTGSFR